MWSGHMGIEVHCIGNKDNDAATSVALSRDGESVAVGYHEGATKVFDVTTGWSWLQWKYDIYQICNWDLI